MKKHDVVTFHTPMPDENPSHRWLLLDEPTEVHAHVARVKAAYPSDPMVAMAKIEYHGKFVGDKFEAATGFFERSIMTVRLSDLVADQWFKAKNADTDAKWAGKTVVIRAPAEKGGKYLSAKGGFSATRKKALRYDYDKDNVGAQVAQLKLMGWAVEVEAD